MMLAATMRYASVVTNVFSTMCVDAMCNDTPAVVIGFDVSEVSYQRSVTKYVTYAHIKDLLEFDAVLHATSMEELIEYLAACLKDPNIKSAERRKCVDVEAHHPDGNAARNVSAFLVERMKAKE